MALSGKHQGIKFCVVNFHDDFSVVPYWQNLLIWQKS